MRHTFHALLLLLLLLLLFSCTEGRWLKHRPVTQQDCLLR
jgi:hypothetical protein